MEYEYADFAIKDHIVIISMNRFERRNSLSYELRRDIAKAFRRFNDDDSLLVAILTGTSTVFCTGWDLKEGQARLAMSDAEKKALQDRERVEAPDPLLLISECLVTKPIIGAINGYAAGDGFFLAMQCDLKVASESATFWVPGPALGLGGPLSFSCETFLPYAVAMEISLSQYITAQRAYELGLVNKVVPGPQLILAAMEMAQSIAKLPPESMRIVLQKMRQDRNALRQEREDRSGGLSGEEKARLEAETAVRLNAFSKGVKPAGGPKA